MIKTSLSLCLLLAVISLSAQDFVNDTSRIDENSYWLSSSLISACFTSARLNELIPQKNSFRSTQISEADFHSLSAYEHFVHAFYFPEWYYQSCSMFGTPNNILQKIPAVLKMQGEGLVMSHRQRDALVENRDSTLLLMQQCVEKSGNIGDEFKSQIISLRAFELIPTMIRAIEKQQSAKDPYILTTLCVLMRYDYEPFGQSKIGNKLYPSDSAGASFFFQAYKRTIPFTQENYRTILDFASAYYEFKRSAPSEFIQLEGGKYFLGEKGHSFNPMREVELVPFQISRYEITNRQFKHFVESTGYLTSAERHKDAFVFRLGLAEFEWIQDSTANWRFPNGISEGGIEEKMDHPVTCISFKDAQAYCRWANVRLPTIEEWEVASRAGQQEGRYYFGETEDSIYVHANIWHGQTHLMEYEGEDALTTSPVGSYKPNPLGLHDIYGNVFEFCANVPEAFEAYENVAVTRGGSWWCSLYACGFFNSVDIGRVQKEATFSNNGFRVVR